MNKTKLLVAVSALAILFSLTGCDDDEVRQNQQAQYIPNQQVDDGQYVNQQAPQVVQAAPAPVIVQSGGHDSGVGDFATGMILGHMMSGGGNNGGYSNNSNRTTIINNHTTNTIPRSSYSSNTTRFYDAKSKQVSRLATTSRSSMNSSNSYATKKAYSSPISSYSKPSRSYSSKSYSSSRSNFSSRSSSSTRRR